MVAQQVQWQED